MTTTAAQAQEQTLQYYYGTGRRKTAIAQVRLYLDNRGVVAVNGRPLEETVPWEPWRVQALEPLKVTGMLGKLSVVAKCHGGGVSAWAIALRHGIARALLVYDPNFRPTLRQHGFLTRDPREKERKKYGLHRARRAHQYSKR